MDSVPPEVKTISRGSAPTGGRTGPGPASMRSAASRPAACGEEGFAEERPGHVARLVQGRGVRRRGGGPVQVTLFCGSFPVDSCPPVIILEMNRLLSVESTAKIQKTMEKNKVAGEGHLRDDRGAPFRRIARKLKVCGHPVRLKLLRAIESSEPCVSDLWRCVGGAPARGLAAPRRAEAGEIVASRVEGNRRIYSVTDPWVRELIGRLGPGAMHEWALADAVIEATSSALAGREPSCLRGVTVQMGELQAIDHEIFTFALETILAERPFAPPLYHLETEPASFLCWSCGRSGISTRAPGSAHRRGKPSTSSPRPPMHSSAVPRAPAPTTAWKRGGA